MAKRLGEAAQAGGHIALSGGSTPGPAYGLAARVQPDWSAVELWWADERCVPPDDERSNYSLVRKTLLDRLTHPPRAVHRIRGELGVEKAAAAYETEFRDTELDLALLGIGADGHTASLFPGASALTTHRLVAAVEQAEPPRVTLTVRALNVTRLVLFFAVGPEKAEAAARAFRGVSTPSIPASIVRGRDATMVFLDRAAAAKLRR